MTRRRVNRTRLWVAGGSGVVLIILVVVIAVRILRPDAVQGSSTMFAPSATADIARQVASVEPEARRLMDAWWRDHGATADDAGFARWIAGAFPAPPSQTERTREAHGLESLASARTSQGVADAKWLDDHGNDDVWTFAGLTPSHEWCQ